MNFLLKFLHLIVLIHFIPFQRHSNSILSKIFLWLALPLTFYLTAIIFYCSKFIHSQNKLIFNPLSAGIIVLILLYLIPRYLDKINKFQKDKLTAEASKFNTWHFKTACVALTLMFYTISVIAVVISLKYFVLLHR